MIKGKTETNVNYKRPSSSSSQGLFQDLIWVGFLTMPLSNGKDCRATCDRLVTVTLGFAAFLNRTGCCVLLINGSFLLT